MEKRREATGKDQSKKKKNRGKKTRVSKTMTEGEKREIEQGNNLTDGPSKACLVKLLQMLSLFFVVVQFLLPEEEKKQTECL